MKFDYLVVGAGVSGLTFARMAADSGSSVLVIDYRDHIGGNCYDQSDNHGVLIQPYGPHIFHTNNDQVVQYLNRFTSWRPYEHRVLASVDGKDFPFPINRTTINMLYDLQLDEAGVDAFLDDVASDRAINNSEDMAISKMGRELYELFIRGYSRKQWGLDPGELDSNILARIPVRSTSDDRYFTDKYQQMPVNGFTSMCQAMLDHPLICLEQGRQFIGSRDLQLARHVIYTGKIDSFFDYRFGHLGYRSLRFEQYHIQDSPLLQKVAVVNYVSELVPYTRITEFRHLTGQSHSGTSLAREFPCASGEPFYPLPTEANRQLYEQYRALATTISNVTFLGRLGTYCYMNMDQAVLAAMNLADSYCGQSSCR